MLACTIYVSFLGALGVCGLPRNDAAAARKLALLSALAGLGLAVAGFVEGAAVFKSGGWVRLADVPWIPALGIRYELAADGISATLVLLTGLASVAGVLFSWNIEHRAKEFFAFYLTLIGGVYGVFLSADAFLLFVFYELAIIPKYFLIAIWGSTRKEYGAMKLALYSFVGSAMVLVGLLAAYVVSGAETMSLAALAAHPFPRGFQMWAFPLVFVGFGILAGLWPFHTWAPTGHVAAPTAASMLLAGVVMKLGAYGCLRVAMALFPEGMGAWGFGVMGVDSWRTLFAVLAVVGIVYGALVALVQTDFKFVIGYSSVSHMGFVMLGLMTLDGWGLSGAVLQMFSHGVIAGLLFAVVGRMVYDRTHTREFDELEWMGLGRAMPFAAGTFAVAGCASMGLPGFSGFVAELQVLLGAWRAFPTLAVVTGAGILVGAGYILRALQRAFYSDVARARRAGSERAEGQAADAAGEESELEAISVPERVGAMLLMGATLWVGLYPKVLLDVILPALGSPWLEGVRGGVGP